MIPFAVQRNAEILSQGTPRAKTSRPPWAFPSATWGRRWKCRRKGRHLSSARQLDTTIREDFRFFFCKLCHQAVTICSHCDRGQGYCSEACSRRAHRKSMREAGRRYQQTPCGRRKHAARQSAYLLRKSTSERSGKDDASGYPNASVIVHTVREDVEGDLGDALAMRHLMPAVARELEKAGRPMVASLFDPYVELVA